MELIAPKLNFKADYDKYIQELGNEERYPYPMDLPHHDFEALIQLLHDYSEGRNLPVEMVPNTTFWLVNKQEIVGVAHLRHTLNSALSHAGGHIGVGVRPKYRGKGLSKKLLEMTLAKALQLNIQEVHIHCYKDNAVSANMIKSVGAILSSELTIELGAKQKIVQRYIYQHTV